MAHACVTNSIVIAAPPDAIWAVLIDPAKFAVWYGLDLDTTWVPGATMAFSGTVGAKKLRDHGTVLEVNPPVRLSWSYFSRITGLPDAPENHSIIALDLAPHPEGTLLTVTHTVPPSPVRKGKDWEIGPESGEKHVAFWWRSTLPILKTVCEGGALPLAASMRTS